MPLLSVIIPIYKSEDYLHKCIDSVLNQRFKDIEVILVNDGSPDNSPLICDEYANKDNRVNVIHKKNGGSSEARNIGIKAALGKYLLFLDSDDYWEGINALNNLVKTINQNQADVILYGTKDVNLISKSEVISRGWYNIPIIQKDKESAIKSLFETGHFPGSAWVIAIKRSIVLEHELFFINGIKAEDIDWLINVFVTSKTFDAVNDPFYMYIKNRPGSITNTSDLKSGLDVMVSVSKWYSILKNDLTQTNRLLLSFLAYQYLTVFIIYSKLSKTDRRTIKPLLIKEKRIIKYLYGIKGFIGKVAIAFLGINGSSHFFRFVYETNINFQNVRHK